MPKSAALVFAALCLWLGHLFPLTSNRQGFSTLPTQSLCSFLTEPISSCEALNRNFPFSAPQLGQFVVYNFHNSSTMLLLTEHEGQIALEEICISKAKFNSLHLTYGEWARKNFPKALSHFRILFAKDGAGVIQTSVQKLIKSDKFPLAARLLPTLWRLEIDPTTVVKRSAIKSENLKLESTARAEIFCAKWPHDASQLANQPLILQFASPSQDAPLNYWPTLIRLGRGLYKEQLLAIAVGQLID